MECMPGITESVSALEESAIEESAIEETTSEESTNEETNSQPSLSSSSSEEQCGVGIKRRRKQSRKTFFEGKARKPYRVCKSLRRSLEESDTTVDAVCSQCAPPLSKVIVGLSKAKASRLRAKEKKEKVSSSKKC